MDIRLNFVNKSQDVNNSQIVVCEKNGAADMAPTAVAWTVISYCGANASHPFVYAGDIEASCRDSHGNQMARMPAERGQAFQVTLEGSGNQLSVEDKPATPDTVQVANALPKGAVTPLACRSGRLTAAIPAVAPGQTATFRFKPEIWIGVVSQVEEGQILDTALLDTINARFSLEGIVSADIVMTGGGGGPEATPFQFSLRNVVMG